MFAFMCLRDMCIKFVTCTLTRNSGLDLKLLVREGGQYPQQCSGHYVGVLIAMSVETPSIPSVVASPLRYMYLLLLSKALYM